MGIFKRTLLLKIFMFLAISAACIGLTACQNFETSPLNSGGLHTDEMHTPSDWIVDKNATKTEDGEKHKECTICGEITETVIIPATGSVGLRYSVNDDGKTCAVTGIGECTDTEVYIPQINSEGYIVTSIGEFAFSGYSSLTLVTIPESVKSIGEFAFSGCSSLTSIIIPDSISSIGNSAFENCSSLTSVTIPSSVTSIGTGAFYGCSALQYNIYDNAKYLGNKDNPFVVLVCAKDKTITSCDINQNTKFIFSAAFYSCSSLNSITIPDSVISVGAVAFYGCSSLTSIIIPEGVISIGWGAFENCSGLTSITIPSSVTSIDTNVFGGCIELESIVVSSGNAVYHSSNNCIIETASKTLIAGCKDSVIPTDGSVTSIGEGAFENCSALTSVTIPDSVTSIGYSAFSRCSTLTSVTIPDSVTSIDYYAFYACSALTSVTIPDSVTSIGNWAFEYCNSLTSVTIGNSVKSIGSGAFSNCGNLKNIFYYGKVEDWVRIEIEYWNKDKLTSTTWYYSETEPALNSDGTAYNGKYWHYDTDGVTPVIWKKEN